MATIKDQVFVVTGGGGAIARPIVQAFAAAGAKVVAVDRSAEIAGRAADAGAWPLAADLSTAAGAELVSSRSRRARCARSFGRQG